MAIDKIQSESINLADTFAFTGTVTGAGADNKPAFHARQSGDQNLTRATSVKLTSFSEELDTNSAFASDKFTVPSGQGGKYLIYFSASFNSGVAGGDGEDYMAEVYKNGSALSGTRARLSDNGGFKMFLNNGSIGLSGIYTLAASDYIELYAYTMDQNASGSIQANAHTTFGAYRIIT